MYKRQDLFSTQEERDEASRESVRSILISDISDFPNHPFKVKLDECKQYRDIYDECSKMVDKHSFIATVTDGDAVRNSIALTEEEVKQLSKYIQLLKDCDELEQMQIYLQGCRDMYYMLKMLEIIE